MLNDYWEFTASLVPLCSDEKAKEAAAAKGFFTKYMTACFQMTTMGEEGMEEGDVLIQSGFVTGVEPGEDLPEDEPDEERPDIAIVKEMYKELGFNIDEMSVNEILATPLLISKRLVPNGVVDMVELFDRIKGGSFFGNSNVEPQDYVEFAEFCRSREAKLDEVVQEIIEELLLDERINSPLDAIDALFEITKAKVIRGAVLDSSVDASIFGESARVTIEEAREHIAMGDIDGAGKLIEKATDEAIVSMCGMSSAANARDKNGAESVESEDSSKNGYTNCIKCRKQVALKEVIKPNSWRCPKCRHEVDVCTGKTIREGNVAEDTGKPSDQPKLRLLAPVEAKVENIPKDTQKPEEKVVSTTITSREPANDVAA